MGTTIVSVTKYRRVCNDRNFITDEPYNDYEYETHYEISIDRNKTLPMYNLICENTEQLKYEDFLDLVQNKSKNATKIKQKMSEGFKLLNEMFNKILQIPNSSIAKKSQLQAIQQSYNDSVSYFFV